MLPAGCVRAELFFPGCRLDASLETLSFLGFTFRLPCGFPAEGPDRIRLHFFSVSRTVDLPREQLAISTERTEAFCTVVRAETESPAYASAARAFMADFRDYTALKTTGDPALVAHGRLGYPMDKENSFPESGRMAMEEFLSGLAWDEGFREIRCPVGVCLHTEDDLAAFTRLDRLSFPAWYRKKAGLAHPLLASPAAIGTGSAFCPRHLPSPAQLLPVLRHAREEGFSVFVEFPPVRTAWSHDAEQWLIAMARTAYDFELSVNDWGTYGFLQREMPGRFTLSLGRLLAREPHDPRFSLYPGLRPPSGLPGSLPPGFSRMMLSTGRGNGGTAAYPVSLFLPFYPTNTSALCTLRARLETGDRGCQTEAGDCGRLCDRYVFVYPRFLRMIGAGNTLFGFDARSLTDSVYLLSQMGPACDRLIFDFLF